uniref:Hac prophage II protein n=1 Tax=Helicobacter phage SwC520G TaxID=1852686 RepID=A0A1S5RHE0_9VIRU|nr:hypothetical protein [Helicobacter phage SwC520G]
MRQKHETATSFNQLKEITQAIQAQQAQKTSVQTSANANNSEIESQSTLTPKARAHTKKGALNPTKRAFSERQRTAFRDHSQASANLCKTKTSHNANAFKTEQGLNSSLRAKQSDEALKQSLATTHQTNKKGGNNAKA